MFEYFNNGEPRRNIIYYDSLEMSGVKNEFKKRKKNVLCQKSFNIVNGQLKDGGEYVITRIKDKNNNNTQTNIESGDLKIVEYNSYNSDNKIIKTIKTDYKDTISIQRYKYNSIGQLVYDEYIFSNLNSSYIHTYFYDKSLLTKRIDLKNSDTTKTQVYKYEGEILKSIDVNDIKRGEQFIVEVECE